MIFSPMFLYFVLIPSPPFLPFRLSVLFLMSLFPPLSTPFSSYVTCILLHPLETKIKVKIKQMEEPRTLCT